MPIRSINFEHWSNTTALPYSFKEFGSWICSWLKFWHFRSAYMNQFVFHEALFDLLNAKVVKTAIYRTRFLQMTILWNLIDKNLCDLLECKIRLFALKFFETIFPHFRKFKKHSITDWNDCSKVSQFVEAI